MHVSFFYPDSKLNFDVIGITNDSRKIRNGYIYVAAKTKKYIKDALKRGASLIISNKHSMNKKIIYNKKPFDEYIRLLKIYYGNNKSINTIGITGTDGKTTTSTILNAIFNEIDTSCYCGTNGIKYLNKQIKTENTTPNQAITFPLFQTLKKHNINNLVMEVSSEGILDNRIEGINFNGAIFTNLTHEHLNSHKNMHNYFLCKARLFSKLGKKDLLCINIDDEYAYEIKYYTKAKIITYGFNDGDYKINNYQLSNTGSYFNVYYKGKYLESFNIKLIGKYNIYNALAAISYAYEIGIPIKYIKSAIEKIEFIDGRYIEYKRNNVTYIIDYAHTPNALNNLIESTRKICKGKIICITGAQGEKDASKRCIMGNIASSLADIAIFTSEDPKNESLFNIFNDLTKDIKNNDYYLTLTRYDAIKLATRLAGDDDYVLITGKGNEEFENILGFKFKHSDFDTLKKALDS